MGLTQDISGGLSAVTGRDASALGQVVFDAAELPVPGAWMFTFPTAMGGTWSPGVRAMWHEPKALGYEPIKVWCEGARESRHHWNSSAEGRLKRHAKRWRRRLVAMRGQSVDGPILDARDHTDGNVAHFLYQVLTRALVLRRAGVEPTVVLRGKAHDVSVEALRLFGFESLRTDAVVHGELWDATPGKAGAYEPWLSALFGDAELVESCPGETPGKVFIARRGSRALVNHDAVDAFLSERGFVTRYFEDLPLIEQWATMRQAESVVAVHGAALANLAFATRGPSVVELFHPGYVVDCYRHLTAAVGGRWSATTGKLGSEDLRDVEERNERRACQARPIEVDLEALGRALDAVDG